MKQFSFTPHISEKSMTEAANGTYIFDVPVEVNKHEIAAGIAAHYGVTVEGVRTIRRKGKTVRTYRGRGRFAHGNRKDSKKAYVSLQEGQTIPVFEESK